MDEWVQVAGDLLDAVRTALRDRRLIAREAPQPRPSQGAARTTARLVAPLLGPNKRPVGTVRVLVIVPNDPLDGVDVHVRWTRVGFAFWYVKTVDLGPLEDAEAADLAGVEMVLTAVGWTASGSVPLRSMNRAFPKVRKSASDAAR
jgi:hypothetical protein